MSGSACVVGSGPAGVAVADALLKQGVAVCMVDAGLELEAEKARAVEPLLHRDFETWDEETVAAIARRDWHRLRGVPKKLAFGSDFVYRDDAARVPLRQDGVELLPSLALGGLSNVWGAAVMPYRREDIASWPVTTADLAPHYRAVLEAMPLAAQVDDLSADFPLYAGETAALDLSPQAWALMRDLTRHRDALRQLGVRFGHARLAVQAASADGAAGCVYCALCMHGCPKRAIYNAGFGVARLKLHPNFRYIGDTVVDEFSEGPDAAAVLGRHRTAGAGFTYKAERLYLAAGVVGTARIVLRSLRRYGRPLRMLASQHFLLPMLHLRNTNQGGRLHTLAQLFLEIFDCAPEGKTVHLQIYTYNDLVFQALAHWLRFLGPSAERLARGIVARSLFVQGYLHSDHSPAIEVRLEEGHGERVLIARPLFNQETRPVLDNVLRTLWKSRGYLGAIPVRPMMHVGKPGEGSHVGGTFPMRPSPTELETDILGRPPGLERIHIVDASVLPSIPATTITLSVMANAHRIGSLHNAAPSG